MGEVIEKTVAPPPPPQPPVAVSPVTIAEPVETGIKCICQGKGPEYRLAQMFPGVPPEVRARHRFDWRTVEVPQMVKALKEVEYLEEVVREDDATGRRIPEHSMLSDDAMGLFVTGNMALRNFMVEEMQVT